MIHKFGFLSALTFGLLAASSASATTAEDMVVLGTDYFHTMPGSFFTFDGMSVPVEGYPIGPGNTDTIIQRTTNTVINGDPGQLLLTALSLVTTESVQLPTSNDPFLYITLNPADLALDTGTITITGTLGGGTFTSSLNVYFDVCLKPGANGVGCADDSEIASNNFVLTNTGSPWGPTAPPGALIVPQPPNSDQAANMHSDLASNEVDFWGSPQECYEPNGCHLVQPSMPSIPEPSTWVMLLAGFGGLGLAAARRRRSEAAIAS